MADGLMIASILANGFGSFVDSYQAGEDRKRKQAESDEVRAMKRRELKREDFNSGAKYNEEKQDYEPANNGMLTKQAKEQIAAADKEVESAARAYQMLSEDQKNTTREGESSLKTYQQARDAASALRRRLMSGVNEAPTIAPTVATPEANPMAQPTTKSVPAIPQAPGRKLSVPQLKTNVETFSQIPNATAATPKPTGMLTPKPKPTPGLMAPVGNVGGMTRIPGRKTKAEQAAELQVQTEVAKKEALANLPAQVRLKGETAETKQKIALLKDGYRGLGNYINAVNQGATQRYVAPDTKVPIPFTDGVPIGKAVSSEPLDEARFLMSESVGRLHSGGAIGNEERDSFLGLIPTAADYRDMKTVHRKLKAFDALMRSKMETFGYSPDELGVNSPPELSPIGTSNAATPGAKSPGAIIRNKKTGKTYQIAEDGETLNEIK